MTTRGQGHERIDALLSQLKENRFLKSEEEEEAFEDALNELTPTNLLPADVESLFLLFEEATNAAHMIWGLLHWLEQKVDKIAKLQAQVTSTKSLSSQAPEWLEILWTRTLRKPEYVLLLQQAIIPLILDSQAQDLHAYLAQLAENEEDGNIKAAIEQLRGNL